ncbi:hypothetical protein [uncultured Brachyspira sp.]|uniref:hypothetical protein n=1 Tax=uncultured Brachyspira sp. TaxID=221953 RepID=UPI00261DFEAB|nr:hypothetical protein [uncultured Brachyspira sp.]
MKKLIITILALSLLSAFSISCSKGFSFYDLGGTWVGDGGSFSINTSAKTINKNNITYQLNGNPPETKAQLLNIMLLKDGVNAGNITFTSKTEANGTGDFNGAWTKQ